MVLTRTSSLATVVDGDVGVMHAGGGGSGGRGATPPQAAAPPTGPPSKAKVPRANKLSRWDKVHNLGTDGMNSTNRRNQLLCPEFQAGTCSATLPNTHFCLNSPPSVHQCAKCLGVNHGATVCHADSGPKAQGKGKGKGKWGKGNGKGGKW